MSKATIPVKVLYEAVPHIVSVEMKNGEAYRGKLASVEENMNCLVEGRTLWCRFPLRKFEVEFVQPNKEVENQPTSKIFRAGVTKTHKDGRTTTLEQVYLRGSHIRLFQLPDLIKHARVLKQGIVV